MADQPDIDIKENYIKCLDSELLGILLKDRSSGKNIIWGTDIYAEKGSSYDFNEPITAKLITGRFGKVIRPRTDKSQKEQKIRIKDKAEVFTPSWICNEMNNHLCDEWFETKNVFNISQEKTWKTSRKKIKFKNIENKTWQDFVNLKVLEISCGEAPFLASRYDTTTGTWIDVNNRIGALDRKLRVVNENTNTEQEWYEWTLNAIKSTYGYEWQGDSLLIARENILFTFIDYYIDKFGVFPIREYLIEVAKILSWNIWQMDGLKYVIPNSCKPVQKRQMSLFEEEQTEPCTGCLKNDNSKHTGTYCKIMNWQTKRTIKFFKGEKRMKFDFVIGNPPYQVNTKIDANRQEPVYNYFMEECYRIGNTTELITPARFLFNAGQTPTAWNNKMLNDKHFKVLKYEIDASKIFQNTDIKGGVAISYYDNKRTFQPIINFIPYPELDSIFRKVKRNEKKFFDSVIYAQSNFNLDKLYEDYPTLKERIHSNGRSKQIRSNAFEKFPEIFINSKDKEHELGIYGLLNHERTYKWINSKYIEKNEITNKYKVLLPQANGSGAIGEVLSTPLIGEPLIGYTQSFIGIGLFDSKLEALACLKYIKGKFSRVMLGTLKITQNNSSPEIWSNVPLQDFTDKSDIDWSKSIHEIDLQLYKKYGLDENEIAFIESHVKEMK